MKLCNACHRHVRPTEGACPFCAEVLPTTGATRLGAVVLLGVLGAACSSRPLDETGTDGPSSSSGATTDLSGPPTGSQVTIEPSTGTATAASTSTATASSTTGDSTTGEQSSLSDPDTSDSGCSFYGGCPPDFGSTLLCDTWVQDCPAGQKCTPFSNDGDSDPESAECFPVAPDPDAPGEPCTAEGSGLDSCDGTSLCWGISPDTLEGQCLALCTGTPDAPMCPADTSCVGFNDITNLCAPTCDPLMPACAADQVCINNPDDADAFVCVHDISGDGGALFGPCEFLNGCDVGLTCVAPDSAVECDPLPFGCCLPYCDLGMPTCTGDGAQCEPWFKPGEAPAGLDDLGVCILPP